MLVINTALSANTVEDELHVILGLCQALLDLLSGRIEANGADDGDASDSDSLRSLTNDGD